MTSDSDYPSRVTLSFPAEPRDPHVKDVCEGGTD